MTKAEECLGAAALNSKSYIDCANGKKGRKLHADAGELTKALNPAMYFVPWIIIDGKREERAFGNLKEVVCSKYKGPKPEACPTEVGDGS